MAETSAAEECKTNDQWQVRRGEIATYRYLLGVPEIVRYQIDNMNDLVFDDEVSGDTGNELED